MRKKEAALPVIEAADWLVAKTGLGRRAWLARVQELIADNTTSEGRFEGHGETNVTAWMIELLLDVERAAPPQGKTLETAYDGNMWVAAVMGHILSLWFFRTQRAKAMDPKRPIKIRSAALKKWRRLAAAFVEEVLIDDSEDAAHFPGQKWNHPDWPGAKDGKFV